MTAVEQSDGIKLHELHTYSHNPATLDVANYRPACQQMPNTVQLPPFVLPGVRQRALRNPERASARCYKVGLLQAHARGQYPPPPRRRP